MLPANSARAPFHRGRDAIFSIHDTHEENLVPHPGQIAVRSTRHREDQGQGRGAPACAAAGGRSAASAPVTEGDGGESISIPPSAARLFLDALTQLGQCRAVSVAPEKAELTPQEVADHLNVSRDYVDKLIESGKLPTRLVGTRGNVSFNFDEEDRKARCAALDELARIDQELKL